VAWYSVAVTGQTSVALAMRHRKGDEHPAYVPEGNGTL